MTKHKVKEPTDEPLLTYRALCEGLEADPDFPTAALEELKRVDPDSTYTLATSAGRLLNHWTVQRDLKVYERGRVVDDVATVVLYPDENGSFEAADRAVERGWKIDLAEFRLLLFLRDIAIPVFLRDKAPPAPDEAYTENGHGWTVAGAARELHRRYSVEEEAMRDHLMKLVHARELPLINTVTGLPFVDLPETVRDFEHRIRTRDLNKYFSDEHLDYRLDSSIEAPQPAPPVKTVDRRRIIAAFEVAKDKIENSKYWDDKLSTPPKWLVAARFARGKPGRSNRWNPVFVGLALLDQSTKGKTGLTLPQLDTVFRTELREFKNEWDEATLNER